MVLALCVLGVQAAEVVWFDGQGPITYRVPKKVEPVVKIALEMWKSDMKQVTGLEPVADGKARVILKQSQRLPEDGSKTDRLSSRAVTVGAWPTDC